MKKFELTAEFVTNVFGKKLFRIKALVAFGNVEKGELGGFIEKEDNLSHDGNAWVYPAAAVPAFWSRRRGTKSNVLCLNSWFTSLYIKGTEKQPYMGVQLFQAFGLTFRLAVTNAEKGNDRGDVLKRQRVGIFCPQNTQ